MLPKLGVLPPPRSHALCIARQFFFFLLVATNAHATEPSPARQTELRNLLKNDCGACHGLSLHGGMGPALLPENLAGKPDELLVATILEGRKGTAMPPWQPFMNRNEAVWLVGVLREGKH